MNLTARFLLSREFAKYWFETSLKPVAALPPSLDYVKKLGTVQGVAGHRKKIIFIGIFTGSLEIPAYAASKGALASLVNGLSNEWIAKRINVNALAPGYIETDLTRGVRDGVGLAFTSTHAVSML